MRKLLLSAIILSLLSIPVLHPKMVEDVHAATAYYVDGANGNNDWAGTEAQPWKTISKAASTLVAGDTVYVKSGTYVEKVTPARSGSSGNWITYKAFPGHTVTIDGANLSFGWGNGLFTISGKSYIEIDGFRMINSDMFGVCASGANQISVKNCYFYNCDGSGVWAGDSSTNITVNNNEVHACCADSFQEGISMVGVNGFEISNNWVHDFPWVYYDSGDGQYHPKEGIDAKVGSTNGSIHHNKVHGTRTGIYLDGYSATTANTDVYNNLVYDIEEVGIAINAERGGTVENCSIYNNICHTVGYHGLKINNQASSYTNISFVNNTTYNNNGNALQIVEGGATMYNLVVRNNIFACGSGKGVFFISGYNENQHHFDHNLFQYGPFFGSDYLTGDPGFTAPGSDFRLQSNSIAIDAGSSAGAPVYDIADNSRPSGNAFDMGAYEFGGSASLPTNQPPVLDPIGNKTIDEGQLLQFTISATDLDSTNLSYSATNLPSGASFDSNTKVFSWTPADGQSGGYSNVYFEVSDGSLSDSEAITITVNDAITQPQADPPSIGFASPTDPDGATVERNWTEVNASVSSTIDTSSFINLDASLVGYWDLDDNSGSSANDGSTYNIDGTFVNSPQWTNGKYGPALNMNGTSDYIDCTNNGAFNITEAITLEAWANSDSVASYQHIVNKGGGVDSAYQISLHDSTMYGWVTTSDGQQHNYHGNTALNSDTWYHLALTYDGSTMKYYVNGIIDFNSGSDFSGNLNTNNMNLVIGTELDWGNYFDGIIDEVKIWNRALSQDEILASYNSTLNGLTNQFNNLSNGTHTYYAYTTDTAGNSAQTETRSITVASDISAPPVLDPIGSKSIDEGDLLQFTISASDSETDPLTFSASNLPTGASFDPNNQIFSWTPDYSQEGTYASIHFEVGDGTSTDSEDITITVSGSNQPPILSPIGAKSVTPGELLQFTISATDPDGSNLIYAATNLPSGASFDAQTQTFTWTPATTGVYSNIHFEISDGELTDSEDIIIIVSEQSNVWDINQDGAVNVLDLIRIGQHWNETGSPGWIPEDVNQDGTIDVLDNIMIGQHWTS